MIAVYDVRRGMVYTHDQIGSRGAASRDRERSRRER